MHSHAGAWEREKFTTRGLRSRYFQGKPSFDGFSSQTIAPPRMKIIG